MRCAQLIEDLIIGLVIGGLFFAISVYVIMRIKLQSLAERLGLEFELDFKMREGKLKKQIANNARNALKGQVAEHLAPLLKCELEDFHLADMTFIGAPIDYLIIDGYNEFMGGNPDREIRVVLADIKAGRKAQLTTEQKRIRDACEAGRVEFRIIKLLEGFE